VAGGFIETPVYTFTLPDLTCYQGNFIFYSWSLNCNLETFLPSRLKSSDLLLVCFYLNSNHPQVNAFPFNHFHKARWISGLNPLYMYKYEIVYVCPAACRRTHTSHHPEIRHGLLISPGLGTKPGDNPKCWPTSPPRPRPLLILTSLDQSAWDYFTIVNNKEKSKICKILMENVVFLSTKNWLCVTFRRLPSFSWERFDRAVLAYFPRAFRTSQLVGRGGHLSEALAPGNDRRWKLSASCGISWLDNLYIFFIKEHFSKNLK
jgi:hypothetical protein